MTFGSLASPSGGVYQVSLSSTPDTPAGSTMDIDVLVENTDSEAGEKTVELYADGELKDSSTVNLNGGASTTVTFSWSTEPTDECGTHTVEARSPDDSDSASVSVLEPTAYAVSIRHFSSKIITGKVLEIPAVVFNCGEHEEAQNVELVVDGNVVDTQSVSVAGSNITEKTWSWSVPSDYPIGTADITLKTNFAEASSTVEVVSYLIVDDYESYSPAGNASLGDNYTFNSNSNNWTIDTNVSADGSQSVKDVEDGSGNAIMWSLSGLDYYPQEGDIFRCAIYFPSGSSSIRAPGWGEQGEQSDAIATKLDPQYNSFKIVRWGSSLNNENLASTNLDFSANSMIESWFEIEVEWVSNEHTVTVYDGMIEDGANKVKELTGSDGLGRTSGGIKYLLRDGVRMDGYKIVGGDRL